MNAKQWLGRARFIDREIDLLLKAKEKARDDITKITQTYDADVSVQTTKDPHKFDRLVELESLIDKKIDELTEIKAEILKAIYTLTDGRQKRVLIAYYINMQTFEEIAVDMHYSFRQITRIRLQGIREINRTIGDKIEQGCP